MDVRRVAITRRRRAAPSPPGGPRIVDVPPFRRLLRRVLAHLLPRGEFLTGDADVHLGHLDAGTPEAFPGWMSRGQFAYWLHTHLTIDVVPCRGAGFSLEAPNGQPFPIRSRLFSDAEAEALEAMPRL
jgi:hypothetical protein